MITICTPHSRVVKLYHDGQFWVEKTQEKPLSHRRYKVSHTKVQSEFQTPATKYTSIELFYPFFKKIKNQYGCIKIMNKSLIYVKEL